MRTRPVLLPLVIALVLALLAGGAPAQQREVVVGLLYPLSGPTASAGVDEKHVFELFADMVNGKEPMIPGAFYQKLKGLPGFPGGARLRLGRRAESRLEPLAHEGVEILYVHAPILPWRSSPHHQGPAGR